MANNSLSLKITWALVGLAAIQSVNMAHAAVPMPPETLVFAVIHRDFPYYGYANPTVRLGNPFFENDLDTTGPKATSGVGATGGHNFVVVKEDLDPIGRPQFAGFTNGTQYWQGGSMASLESYFNEWFGKEYLGSAKFSNGKNAELKRTKLMVLPDGRTVYEYRYERLSNPEGLPGYSAVPGYPGYFPLPMDYARGTREFAMNYGSRDVKFNGQDKNFSFTSEFTASFTLPEGAESFEVTTRGDDDTWSAVNGHVVTGWIKQKSDQKNINYNNVSRYVYHNTMKLPYGVEIGKPMTIQVFYADRHTGCASISIVFKVIMSASNDSLNVSAKAVPVSAPAKVWFNESESKSTAVPLAP